MAQQKRQPMTDEEYEKYKEAVLYNVEKMVDEAHKRGLGFYVMGMLAGDVDMSPEVLRKRKEYQEREGHDDDDVLVEGGFALRGFFETYHQVGASDIATAIASSPGVPGAEMLANAYSVIELIVEHGTISMAEAQSTEDGKTKSVKDFKTIGGKHNKKLYKVITDKNNDG